MKDISKTLLQISRSAGSPLNGLAKQLLAAQFKLVKQFQMTKAVVWNVVTAKMMCKGNIIRDEGLLFKIGQGIIVAKI